MNDLGTFLELLAPIFPQFFLVIVCGASISKVLPGLHGITCTTCMQELAPNTHMHVHEWLLTY